MSAQQINRISRMTVIVLSFIALVTVLTGYMQPPQADEGIGAHIFRLTIVLLTPVMLLFLATANWEQPVRTVRLLAIPVAALVCAFAALYYLEHYWYAR